MIIVITLHNIIKHELIGLEVKINESSNKSQIGIKGKVVDETKNLLIIKTTKNIKKIQKKGAVFIFDLKNKKVKVNGDKIVARPEDRIKLKVKKW